MQRQAVMGHRTTLGAAGLALLALSLLLLAPAAPLRAAPPPPGTAMTHAHPGPAAGPELRPPAAPGPVHLHDPGPLRRLAATLPLLAVTFYLLLQAEAALRALRQEPRAALLGLGLLLLALAVRWLAAPRVPMVGQSSDFVHLNGALDWLRGRVSWSPGSSAPAGTAMHFGLQALVGASIDAAFALTTGFGALLVLPVFAAGRRLGGGLLPGSLAGLAAAVLPLSVVFSNGVNLEAPMAFFLAAALQHGVAFVDDARPLDALRLGLALLLFSQLRQDAVLELPVVLAGLLALVLATDHAGRRLASPALWGAVALTVALGLPFVLLTAGAVPPEHAHEVAKALRLLPIVVPAVALLGPVARWLQPRLTAFGAAWRVVLGALLVPALLRLRDHVAVDGPQIFAPSWPARLDLAPDWIHSPVFSATYGTARTTTLDNPWLVPALWLLPAALGLLAPRRVGASQAARAAGLVLAALALFWWRFATTCMAKSGELIADGNRYLVPTAGLLALLVGLGASHLVEALPARRAWRGLAAAVLVALVLSPLVTHRRVLADVDFDQQARYLFLRDAFRLLPTGTLLLAPDHLIYAETPGAPHGGSAWQSSRTPALCSTFRQVLGEPRDCRGLREWAAGATSPAGLEPVLFLDVGCHHTRHGGEDPLCAELRALPGLEPLARTRFANRPYDRYPITDAAEVSIDLLRVPRARVDDVRRRVLGAL